MGTLTANDVKGWKGQPLLADLGGKTIRGEAALKALHKVLLNARATGGVRCDRVCCHAAWHTLSRETLQLTPLHALLPSHPRLSNGTIDLSDFSTFMTVMGSVSFDRVKVIRHCKMRRMPTMRDNGADDQVVFAVSLNSVAQGAYASMIRGRS